MDIKILLPGFEPGTVGVSSLSRESLFWILNIPPLQSTALPTELQQGMP